MRATTNTPAPRFRGANIQFIIPRVTLRSPGATCPHPLRGCFLSSLKSILCEKNYFFAEAVLGAAFFAAVPFRGKASGNILLASNVKRPILREARVLGIVPFDAALLNALIASM